MSFDWPWIHESRTECVRQCGGDVIEKGYTISGYVIGHLTHACVRTCAIMSLCSCVAGVPGGVQAVTKRVIPLIRLIGLQ